MQYAPPHIAAPALAPPHQFGITFFCETKPAGPRTIFSSLPVNLFQRIPIAIKISYSTGNHLERVRQVFDFLDANANNRLEFHEIATAAKDKNFIFFGQHIRTDSEMMQSLLAYQSSPCIQNVLTSLQGSCGVGDRGACLQPERWVAEKGIFMKNPQKIQKCIYDLIQPSYVVSTGDDCTSNQVREWLTSGVESVGSKCLMQTSINIQEFVMYARHLVPGLPSDEVFYPNHCLNTTIDFYLSIYGAMTVFMSLTNAEDAAKARCVST